MFNLKQKLLSSLLIMTALLLLGGITETKAAISSVGTIGSTSSKTANQSSLVLTTSATAEVDNVIIVTVARNNYTTTDISDAANQVTGVTDSASNTYTLAHDYTNGQGSAQTGAWVGVYYTVVTTQLTSGGTITATFANTAEADATAIAAWEFTIGAGNTISANTQDQVAVDGGDFGSTSLSGLANQEWLFFTGIAYESDIDLDGITATTGYTGIGVVSTDGAAETSNMGASGEFDIVTATSTTSDPTATGDTTHDNVSVLVAFEEIALMDFSGVIKQTDEVSAYNCSVGGPYTVRLRVDGGGSYSGDCTLSSGAWSVTGVAVSSGQTVYAYIYNETPKGSTALVSDGTTKSDVDIFQNRVILRDDVNDSITNTEISAGNTADADDLIAFSGSDITVGSSYETHIYTSDTYAPGGNVSTGKLHVVGSYSGTTETLTLTGTGTGTSRPLYVDGGTFTTPDVTTFSGDGDVDIEATTFDALNITPTITATRTYTFLGAETVNGNLNITPSAGTSQTLNVDMGGTITVQTASTTTISGAGAGPAVSILDTRPVSTDYNLSTGLLNIAANGTLDAASSASTITLTGTAGTLFTAAGTFTEGTSTVVMNPDAAVTLFSANPTLYNLSLTPTITSGRTYTVGSALTINGDFTINPGTVANLLTVNMGGDITVAAGKTTTITRTTSATSSLATTASNYNLSTGLLNIATGGTLTAAGSTSNITLTGTSGTLFTLAGTFTAGSSTVIFNPDATGITLFSATPTLYNLSLTPTLGDNRTYNIGAALTINGDFTIDPGTAAWLLTVNAGGNITGAATTTTTITGTTSSTSKLDLRPVTTDYDLTTGLLDIASAGTLDADSAASTITLSGTSGTLFTRVGTFTQGNSTVTVTSASGTPTFNSGTATFNILTINASGATIGSSADAISISNNLNISAGTFTQSGAYTVSGTTAVAAGTTYNINNTHDVTGSLTTAGTGIINTSAGTPTVTVQGTTIGGGSGAITFYALTKSGAGTTTFSGSGTNTINNNLSVSAGTFTQSDILTVTGDGSVATGATLNINNNLNINGGALTTAGTGIINTTAGTPNLTMSGTGGLGGGDGNITLHRLTTSGTGTTSFSGTATNTINENISVGASTTLNINSDVSIAGTLTNTTTGIIGTSAGTPTITLTGTGALGSGSGAITFHHLTTSGVGTHTFTGSGTNTANGNITVGSGTTLNINDSISIAGTLINTTTGIIGTSAGTPTVTMTGTGNLGSGSGAITFHHLSTSGTGTHNFSGSETNTFNGNVTVDTGTTLNLNDTASIAGNLINTTTGIIGYSGTPTLTMTGTSNSIGSGAGAINFYSLTINPSSPGTITANSDATIANTLNIAASDKLTIAATKFVTVASTGSLTLTGEIDGAGTLIYQPAAAFPTTGTYNAALRIDGSGGDMDISDRGANGYGGNVELYSNSGTARVFTLGTGGGQTVDIVGNLTLNAAGANTVSLTGATNDPTVIVDGNISYTAGGSAESITTGTGDWTVGGNVNFTNGTFTATATNTFIMNGAGATVTSNSQTFQNFEVSGGSVSNVDNMDVDGTFNVSGGGFTHGAGADIDINVANDFTLVGTWTENTTASSQLTFDGDLDFSDSVGQSVGNVVIGTSPETTNLSSDYASYSLTVVAGDFFNTCDYEVDIGDGNLAINGTMDTSSTGSGVSPCSGGTEGGETTINAAGVFTISATGTFVQDASTLIMDNTSGTDTITLDGESLYNLTVSPTGTSQFADTIDIDNDVLITAGTLDMNGQTVTIGGNFDNDATLTHSNAAVTFNASSGTKTIDADGTVDPFYDVTFSDGGSGPTYQLSTLIDIDNDITISGGTLDANGQNMNVQGSWNNSGGTFTSNSNTVTFDDTNGGETLAGTMTDSSSFYDVIFNDGASSGVWSFGNNSATVTHDFTITGGTVTAPGSGYALTIAEDFTNDDIFTHNSGSVVFNGTNNSYLLYTGNTTFYDLTISAAGKQVYFDEAQTTIITDNGSLTIQGTTCSNLIYLDSNVDDNPWDLNVSTTGTTVDIDYADVEDSNSTNAITAYNSTEVNVGNTNWTIDEGLCSASALKPRMFDGVRGFSGVRIK